MTASFPLDLDLRGLRAADRPLTAANLDAERVSQRGDRHDLDLRTGDQTHLEEAAAKCPRAVHRMHGDTSTQGDLRKRGHRGVRTINENRFQSQFPESDIYVSEISRKRQGFAVADAMLHSARVSR